MAATRAKTVSVRQHKGWNWFGTWTLVFSYKLPTTRSTAHLSCSSFSHLSTVAIYNLTSRIPWQTDQHPGHEFVASHVSGHRERWRT